MKLFPPQAETKIYEEGFGESDLLGRAASGRQLSELLERIEDPVVVALDGAWGSGKSHFLKRWVGAHTKENGGSAITVYFDAFTNDYLDEPLIGLTGAIGDRLGSPDERGIWERAKTFAFKLAGPTARIGAAMLTSGLSEVTGPVLDAANATGNQELEKAASAFWRREDGRKAAMQHFRGSLQQLTASGANTGGSGRSLIVVIDELDRCRPDYALSVLEVVKHFFSVPRVHFVLGVNLEALAHIVQARYGIGVNAADYLKRFISLSMHLPDTVPGPGDISAQVRYFESAAGAMGLPQALVTTTKRHLDMVTGPAQVSLRDVEKILSKLVILPKSRVFADYMWGWQETIVSLVVIEAMRPDLFKLAFSNGLSIAQIDSLYGFKPEMASGHSTKSHDRFLVHRLWKLLLDGVEVPGTDESVSRAFDRLGRVDNVLPNIRREFFSTFELIDGPSA